MSDEQNTTATATENKVQEPVQITIPDLHAIARIVDLAARRGAFQAAELSQVGEAFNKLAAFLNYVETTQKKDPATEAPATSQ